MKKFEKNYLRIFANINKAEYSEDEKKLLTELLISITKINFNCNKLKYDIEGSGYGISKGDGLIYEKSLNNKLNEKGYKNLSGFKVYSYDDSYKSAFSIFSNVNVLNRLDMYFSWPYNDLESLEKTIEIIKSVSQKLKIDYAYAYPDDKTLFEEGEGRINYIGRSSMLSIPEQELKWEDKFSEITTGTIKKLYPLNVFNKKQIEGLRHLTTEKKIQLSDENQIWIFNPSTLDTENTKVTTKVID
jgi:hypothetical protein